MTTDPTRVTDVADLADVLLTVARKMHAREVRQEGIVHLSAVETFVMRHVDRHPGASPSEVAAAVGLQASNTSTAVRSLERHGLIERRRSGEDGRGVRLFPTPLAATNLERLRQAWRDTLDPHVTSDQDVAAAFRLLAAVDAALAAR